MRVYEPDPREAAIKEAIKDLYLLKQSLTHNAGSEESRLKMIDRIRNKLQDALE